ncbi:hypothetical protein SHO565_40750 [Streptomyces sp. HO565]
MVGRVPSGAVPEAGVVFGAEPRGGTGAAGGVLPGADEDRLPAGAGPVRVRADCGPCGDTARCTGRSVARPPGAPSRAGVPAAGVVPSPVGFVRGAGVARWTGVPAAGVFAAGLVRGVDGVPRAGAPGAAGLPAGVLPSPVGFVRGVDVARWTGVPGAGAFVAGLVRGVDGVRGAGVPVGPVRGVDVARWTGVPAAGVSAAGAFPGRAAVRGTGVPRGVGRASRAARWTGVPGAGASPGAGVPVVGPGRRTESEDASAVAGPSGDAAVARGPDVGVRGAGAVPCGCAARWTGAAAGAGAGPADPAGGVPGPPRSPSADDGAVPEEAGAASGVRRVAGRARRCTAAGADGALVSRSRVRGAAGGTGVARTP